MSLGLNRTTATPTRRAAPRPDPSGPSRGRPQLGDGRRSDARRPDEGIARGPRPSRPPPFGEEISRSGTGHRQGLARSGRILIVDDEPPIRLVCRLNLQTAGFDTLEAADGEAALALARSERPDLILLDIMLPGLDGWAVAERLAASPETREISIVFLSARADYDDHLRAYELGGVGYVTKPFEPVDLAHNVAAILERLRRSEREALRREWLDSLGPAPAE